MTRQRPAVFVGSSSEGLRIAKAIQVNLDPSCEVEVWSQGVFGVGTGTVDALTQALRRFDFAILVLTADDLTTKRGETKPSARDNVILEMGFFLAGLGQERTFMVYDRSHPPDIPSDLAGVTAATFEPHSSGNLAASLGAPCTQMMNEIERLGVRRRYGTYGVTVEAVRTITNTGLAEPTGVIHFTQLSEQNSVGLITVSYGVPITVPWENIEVEGTGGLVGTRLDQSQSSNAAGLITIIVPAGGRHGDTITLSGVRVGVAGTTVTKLSVSIAMKGNALPPDQSYVDVVNAIAPAIGLFKTQPAVIDTSPLNSTSGQLTIKAGFPSAFLGLDRMTSGMTNGTEFLLTLTGLPPGLDFAIEDLPAIRIGARTRNNDIETIQLILLESLSEVRIPYRVTVQAAAIPLKTRRAMKGTVSLAPIGNAFSQDGQPTGAVPRYVPASVGPVTLVEYT